jgi:phosphodiesterase/alkaline phosphatase D-like protein
MKEVYRTSHHGRTDSSSVGRAVEKKKTDFHFAVRGLRCESLEPTAQSRKRKAQGHAQTVFRVRVDGLEPHTTYYYKVDSMQADGTSDGVTSSVNKFTTP